MCAVLGLFWKQTFLLNDLRSNDIHVCIVTKSKQNDPRAFSPHLKAYEKFTSFGRRREGVVLPLREDSNLQVRPLFLDLVVLDVMHTSKQTCRGVAVNSSQGGERIDFFKNFERFLVTSKH